MQFTEDDYLTMDNALMVAAERYREHVKLLRADMGQPAEAKIQYERVAQQFERQAAAADVLRERIANR